MALQTQFELLGLSDQELTDLIEELREPRFRARQLSEALYRQRVASLDEISTLPKALRARKAAEGYTIGLPAITQRFVSRDGTVRYLVRFADGQTVETVWMPEGDGVEEDAIERETHESGRAVAHICRPLANVGNSEQSDAAPVADAGTTLPSRRGTICLSSQAGCAVNCKFCMTALLGVQRNLTAGEIVGQVLVVLNDHRIEISRDRINLVFMGQGEPFLNYDNFMRAVRLLVEDVRIPESRMTVSTSGIVPRIAELGAEPVRPHLAISLNASNDVLREKIMPINRKWKLEAILEAARAFPLRPRERLTFEYVLLAGVNESPENAREVVALLRGLRAKVNLIALNPGPEIPFGTPSKEAVAHFQQVLIAGGIPAYIRRPRGRDIYAACGQLKRMSTDLVTPESRPDEPTSGSAGTPLPAL